MSSTRSIKLHLDVPGNRKFDSDAVNGVVSDILNGRLVTEDLLQFIAREGHAEELGAFHLGPVSSVGDVVGPSEGVGDEA